MAMFEWNDRGIQLIIAESNETTSVRLTQVQVVIFSRGVNLC